MPTAALLSAKRTPVRSQSAIEIPSMTLIKVDVATQYHLDDVAQLPRTSSSPNQPFPGTFDTVALPTMVWTAWCLTAWCVMHAVTTSVVRHLKYAWGLERLAG